jgi:transcriptional regulator with XRE-family HTH domain
MSWSLGKAIKKVRIEQGMSQGALAQQAGLRQAHLSLIENDHHDPSATIVRTLARVLGVSADVLLGLSGEAAEEADAAGVPPGRPRQAAPAGTTG